MERKLISKTTLKLRARKKTNPELEEAIRLATKNASWNKYAKILSQSTRKYSSINLKDIDNQATLGSTILVSGKVLSLGEITKKIKICSLGISEHAKEKLLKTRSEWVSILEEIKKNPKAEGIKLIQ